MSLERWENVGKALWPWLRMLPHAGCDRELLGVIEEVAKLLGKNDEAVSVSQLSQVEKSLDLDASERLAAWFEESRWILRLEKSKRAELLAALRSGAWLK